MNLSKRTCIAIAIRSTGTNGAVCVIRDIVQPRLNCVETGLPVAEAKGGQMGLFG